jgi:hypothetical protein
MLRRLIAVGGIAAATAGLASAGSSTPALKVASLKPLAIRGTHFVAREKVRIRIHTAEATKTWRVVTTPRGSFVVGVQNMPYDPCSSSLIVRARGSRGSEAAVKLPQRQCPPA